MATNLARHRWSYAEFARLPDDGNRYEIIHGELCVTPAPRPRHQSVSMRLSVALGGFVEAHGLGEAYAAPIDVFLSGDDYMEPDLVFVRRERAGIVSERGIEGAPDLVVEIVSPSTALRDRGLKRERYAALGVPLYWIVDAERGQIEVYRLDVDPHEPAEVATEALLWEPVPGGPSLTLDVPHVVGSAR